MKTAKEWFDKYKSNADKYLSMPAIEAIQLDSMKAGAEKLMKVISDNKDLELYQIEEILSQTVKKWDEKDLTSGE